MALLLGADDETESILRGRRPTYECALLQERNVFLYGPASYVAKGVAGRQVASPEATAVRKAQMEDQWRSSYLKSILHNQLLTVVVPTRCAGCGLAGAVSSSQPSAFASFRSSFASASRRIFTCSGCDSVAYCDPACQRRGWGSGGHKVACAILGSDQEIRKAPHPILPTVPPLLPNAGLLNAIKALFDNPTASTSAKVVACVALCSLAMLTRSRNSAALIANVAPLVPALVALLKKGGHAAVWASVSMTETCTSASSLRYGDPIEDANGMVESERQAFMDAGGVAALAAAINGPHEDASRASLALLSDLAADPGARVPFAVACVDAGLPATLLRLLKRDLEGHACTAPAWTKFQQAPSPANVIYNLCIQERGTTPVVVPAIMVAFLNAGLMPLLAASLGRVALLDGCSLRRAQGCDLIHLAWLAVAASKSPPFALAAFVDCGGVAATAQLLGAWRRLRTFGTPVDGCRCNHLLTTPAVVDPNAYPTWLPAVGKLVDVALAAHASDHGPARVQLRQGQLLRSLASIQGHHEAQVSGISVLCELARAYLTLRCDRPTPLAESDTLCMMPLL